MDLKALKDTPPWDWPARTAEKLVNVLRDEQALESDRLLAFLAWIYTSSHSPKFLGAYGSFSPTPCRIYLMYWCADNGNIRMSHFRYVKMAFG